MNAAMTWMDVGAAADVTPESGACVLLADRQVAVYNFASQGRWYAVENRCPHWGENVLSRGLTGDDAGVPKVACPLHKRSYSLETGHCLSEEGPGIAVYPIRVEHGRILLGLAMVG